MSLRPDRLLETTRGRVVALLRQGDMTVDEMAAALGLTDNAVRAHLVSLERDGLVQPAERRGGRVGKPATSYRVSPEVELLLSKAYLPLLTGLLETLGDRLPPEQLRPLLQEAGNRMAAGVEQPRGDLRRRVQAASQLLNQLGGLSSVEEVDGGGFVIRSRGCPVGAAVRERPEVCEAIVSLLADLTGAQVRSCCQRGDRPNCCFEVM
ncbi:MAG TPA: ArsR family transcriptional regulator [Gemmatimonadales bacterium]|nr:ArsR family transcriptional regulator [Gemmatimonadales bacterium]